MEVNAYEKRMDGIYKEVSEMVDLSKWDQDFINKTPVVIYDAISGEVAVPVSKDIRKIYYAARGVIRRNVHNTKMFDIIAVGIIAKDKKMKMALEKIYKDLIEEKCCFDIKEEAIEYVKSKGSGS
jgi:hypothetical protein